jgi:hypothetical protein
VAAALPIARRGLPVAPPAWQARAHLWRHGKGCGLAKRATVSRATSAAMAGQELRALSPRARWRKAGGLSGHFWLTR